MKYKIVECMFFTNDILIESDLTEEEAKKRCGKYNAEGNYDIYTWCEVRKQ